MTQSPLKHAIYFLLLAALSAFPTAALGQDAATNAAPTELTATAVEEAPTILGRINSVIFDVLFFDMAGGRITIPNVDETGAPILDKAGIQEVKTVEVPFLIVFLLCGAIFFSIYFRWISIRGFRHAIQVVRGKFDKPEDLGEISHFRALTSALSATVGLGNIAGVAVAIQLGGPGAVFWMWLAAIFGMAAKFSSCTLSQLYRQVNADGSISGGPMYYLDLGLGAKGPGWKVLGKILAVMFAFMIMGGALGGGNMFQANQTVEAITDTFGLNSTLIVDEAGYTKLLNKHANHGPIIKSVSKQVDAEYHIHLDDLNKAQAASLGDSLTELKNVAGARAQWGIGIVLVILAGVVILGGIKRIGAATSRIVPLMCSLYVLAALFVILSHYKQIDDCFRLIFTMAFTKSAYYGGFVGVLIHGIRRAAFSNEAGLGSAAVAHAAAKTDEPVREGMVAMIGPFIDTIVVCTMTALVVIVTGAWNDPSIPQNVGVTLTSEAFSRGISWFPAVLTGCIALFAYSTMISWCYYGERGWIYLLDHLRKGLGLKTVFVFRIVFVACIFVGATNKLDDVLDFSDAMILSMAFPNILGSVILAPVVFAKLKDYWGRYKSGEMNPVG